MIKRVYINDWLFFPLESSEECEILIKRLMLAGKRILDVSLPLYYNSNIFLCVLMAPDIRLSSFLKNNKELKQSFASFANRLQSYLPIEDAGAEYSIIHLEQHQCCNGTPLSDAYEYTSEDEEVLMINVRDDFPYNIVQIYKNRSDCKDVHSISEEDKLIFLLQKNGILKRYYSPSDTHRPNDYETILTDDSLFEPTEFGNRDNRLYRRKENPNELWCLDRGHTGSSAHLEVFSESEKKQINVSKVDSINFFRPLSPKEKNRKLNIEKMP